MDMITAADTHNCEKIVITILLNFCKLFYSLNNSEDIYAQMSSWYVLLIDLSR